MNVETIRKSLESVSARRLRDWIEYRDADVDEVITEVITEVVETPALRLQLGRLREQWEVAEARMRDKRQKRVQAEERLVAARAELERVKAAFQVEQQVFEQLRNQAIRSAFSSSSPGMSAEAIGFIRAALKPEAPASEVERTRATQAINAFIDRTRRNPACADELRSQIDHMRQAINRAERATEQEMQTEADAQVSLLSVQRTIDYFKGGTEAQKAKNEELRSKVGNTPGAGQMTPEEMKLLRFALHPDRKPGAEELRKASAAFEAYLSRSGSGRAADTRVAEEARRAREAAERQARAEETIRKAKEAARQREAEEAREREWEKDRARYREKSESDTQKRHTRTQAEYNQAVRERAADGNFRIGDILCASWGATMTLVDFYYVEGRRGKSTVVLVPLDDTIVDGDGWSGHKIPAAYRKFGPGDTSFDARASVKGDISVKVKNGARAYLWNGKPQYFNTMD